MGAGSSIFRILSIPCFIPDMMNSARLTGPPASFLGNSRAPRRAVD